MAKAKGILRAITGRTYGLFDGDKALYRFDVIDNDERRAIDPLQGSEVDYNKDIKSLVDGKVANLREVKDDVEVRVEKAEAEEVVEEAEEEIEEEIEG